MKDNRIRIIASDVGLTTTKPLENSRLMFYEDFDIGTEYTTEGVGFSAKQIIEFATTYDPQPFHVDPVRAETTIHGGLIASGWQVFAAAFGAVVRLGLFEDGGQGAGRLDEAYWSRPVRPGDIIHCVVRVLGKRESRTRQDRGYIQMQYTIYNQDGDEVAGFRCDEIVLKKSHHEAGLSPDSSRLL